MKYTTYQYYNHKGERLAIFYDGVLIHVIRCHKKDQFSKKVAKTLFKANATRYLMIEYNFESQFQFNDWCKSQFFKIKETNVYTGEKILSIKKHLSKKSTSFHTIKFLI